MRVYCGLSVIIWFSISVKGQLLLHPLSDEYIAEINKKATTWTAGRNFDISEWELVQQLSNGAHKSHPAKLALYKHNVHDENQEVPEAFESAEMWPKCDSIRQIRDQSRCGSCWAFGAVEAMSDRICIHSNQEKQVYVSALDLLSCCWLCGMGCSGGEPLEAWSYWRRHGIATGGLYNRTDQGCKPYFLPECEDHPHNCENYVRTPKCTSTCANSTMNYKHSLTYGKDIQTFSGEKQIMLEISKNGPVESAFTVMDDFINYKSGIYQPTSHRALGGHAIKIVGWGVENGTKFWKIANSWNEGWGEKGYFRIIRGVNSCGIEDQAVGGMPVLNKEIWDHTVVHVVDTNDI